MARKTEYQIDFSPQMDAENREWNLIATTDSQGTANLIAKLWRDHVARTNPWQAGAQVRTIDCRTGRVVMLFLVLATHPGAPDCEGFTLYCEHCDHREEGDGYGGVECPACGEWMKERPATPDDIAERAVLD